MIDLDLGLEQTLDDLHVAAICGTDQPRPVEAVLRVHVCAGVEREIEQRVSSPTSLVAIRYALCSVESFALTSAPASTSSRAASTWFPYAAATSAVAPGGVSRGDARALLEQRAHLVRVA